MPQFLNKQRLGIVVKRKKLNIRTKKNMSSTSGSDLAWVKWFCGLRGNEFLVEVDDDYIQDRFNLSGLNEQVPHFKRALEIITDLDDDDDGRNKRTAQDVAEESAVVLYELIHARFILSPRGMQLMAAKYKSENFGTCPRVCCEAQACLPVGTSDVPGEDTVKLFCPRCRDIYTPRISRHQQLDGAYFGTGFPSMILLTMPELRPPLPTKKYEPRLYGFKIHPLGLKPTTKLPVNNNPQPAINVNKAPIRKQDSFCSSYGGGGNTSTNTLSNLTSSTNNKGRMNTHAIKAKR